MPTLGLIAGNRTFPIHVARAARAQGYRVIAVGLKEETDPALEQEVDRMHWISLGEVGRVPELFRQDGVKEVLLAGQIKPERLLEGESQFAGMARQLFRLLPDRSGNSAMKMAVQVLESQGFRVLHSGLFLKDWIPQAGVLTRRPPTEEERADLDFGMDLARKLAALGIGQTVIARRKAVVAVEAIEGTDAAIRRAGELAGAGCVVAKASEPNHDMRFDIPVVGVETLRAMQQAKASCLGVEARKALLLHLPEIVAEADRAGLTVVAA